MPRINFDEPAIAASAGGPPHTLYVYVARKCRLRHLPLAARPGVGHIDLDGAVAEWLKAAVC